MKLFLCVATLALCLAVGASAAECPSSWTGNAELGLCYKMFFDRVKWVDAAFNYCALKSGNAAATLAEPRTQAEWDYIKNNLGGEAWLGITDTFNVSITCLNFQIDSF